MKLLRETIRKLLITEVACAGATAKIQQGLDEIEKRNLHVHVIPENGGFDWGYVVLLKDSDNKTVGQFEAATTPECASFVTQWTEVDSSLRNTGIGPVLYDVAVEFATEMGQYLACDRGTVSLEARKMWEYYNLSDDYEAFQMDTKDGDFTPDDPDDDCHQGIFYSVSRRKSIEKRFRVASMGDPNFENEFLASPFTKAYKKKQTTTIPCLGDRYSKEIK